MWMLGLCFGWEDFCLALFFFFFLIIETIEVRSEGHAHPRYQTSAVNENYTAHSSPTTVGTFEDMLTQQNI